MAAKQTEVSDWKRRRLIHQRPRFNEQSDVEATTRLASEAMPTHNPYAPSIRAARRPASHQLDKPQYDSLPNLPYTKQAHQPFLLIRLFLYFIYFLPLR